MTIHICRLSLILTCRVFRSQMYAAAATERRNNSFLSMRNVEVPAEWNDTGKRIGGSADDIVMR